MAKKLLTFTEGEFGFTQNLNVVNEDGTDATISGFTGIRLIIFDEVADTAKLDITTNLTIVGSTVEWAVQDGQTDYEGTFIGGLHLTAPGQNEKVYQFPVIVNKKLL